MFNKKPEPYSIDYRLDYTAGRLSPHTRRGFERFICRDVLNMYFTSLPLCRGSGAGPKLRDTHLIVIINLSPEFWRAVDEGFNDRNYYDPWVEANK